MNRERFSSELTLYPCPVLLVTCANNNKANIITISWAGIACSNPEYISIAVKPKRYSYNLILQSGEFCINVPTCEFVREVDLCGNTSGSKVDKFDLTGFTRAPSTIILPPQISECPISLECSVEQVIKLGGHHLFIGKIVSKSIDIKYTNKDGTTILDHLNPIIYIRPYYYDMKGHVLGAYGFAIRGSL